MEQLFETDSYEILHSKFVGDYKNKDYVVKWKCTLETQKDMNYLTCSFDFIIDSIASIFFETLIGFKTKHLLATSLSNICSLINSQNTNLFVYHSGHDTTNLDISIIGEEYLKVILDPVLGSR